MTGNCKALAALADEPGYVSISPVDADARGIDEEQLVWVASRRGKVLRARRWTSASTTAPCT